MDSMKKKILSRETRRKRIRRKVNGTPQRPRLCVRRSLKHLYVQAVDDVASRSVAQVSSLVKGLQRSEGNTEKPVQWAKRIGNRMAEKLLELGIKSIVFDRGGYLYHGRVKAVADGIREKGIEF